VLREFGILLNQDQESTLRLLIEKTYSSELEEIKEENNSKTIQNPTLTVGSP
jgi:hypothetical protein